MKRYRNQRGAALLEAAITVPIILLISVGIFQSIADQLGAAS